LELNASVGFIYKESVTMHGHTTLKKNIQQHCSLERDVLNYQLNRRARVSQDGEVLRRETVLNYWPT
jgi:hypothetical protein